MNQAKKLLALVTIFALLTGQALAVLPDQLKSARMTDSTLASTIDNEVDNLEKAAAAILGIPLDTAISNAMFEATATGLKSVNFQDAAANPTVAGVLQRNAAALKFHDGTAARTVLFGETTQSISGAWTFTDTITSTLGAITTDKPTLSGTTTWNAGAVTFNGLKLNVTDTASAAASRLLALQVGAADKFVVDKAGALIAGTIDAETSGVTISVPVRFSIPAAGCNNATAGPLFEILTSNSAVATCYGTNPHRFAGLDFADGAAALEVGGHFLLPADWTGAIDFKWTWFSSSQSTNSAVWTIATVCVADTENLLAPTYNTAQTVTDANLAVASTRNSASQASVTTTGCAAGETFFFKFGRDPTNVSDTLAATAVLMDLEVTYRRAM